MIETIETIKFKSQSIAIIIPAVSDVDGISYITDPLNAFQIGLHHRPKGMKLLPHVHNVVKPITITEVQEVLMIISGSIRLTLYSKEGDFIAERILNKGDSVLLIREAHQVEYLEETRMFEVKQGPYPGVQNAKLFIHDKRQK